MQIIRRVLDIRGYELLCRGNKNIPHPFGLRSKEINNIMKKYITKDTSYISTLFDVLIDESYLIPHDQKQKITSSNYLHFRSFEPDGEIVSNKIRRYNAINGLPVIQKDL